MGVIFGVVEYIHAQSHPHQSNVSPSCDTKKLKITPSKVNTGICPEAFVRRNKTLMIKDIMFLAVNMVDGLKGTLSVYGK